jgi:2,4-dienoyl-CoA reductase-like NADH-dependent reductase (Old Yellow Enzyme family)
MTRALFTPFTCKSLHLQNRVVMAPMTRQFSPQGVPGSDVADYYRRRAVGGAGLILTEGTTIARDGASYHPSVPCLEGPALAGWQDVVHAVHGAGSAIAVQLWHVGTEPEPHERTLQRRIEGPSGLTLLGAELGQIMSDRDIADTISAYARSARDSMLLGFDAIEVHAAHGYLIDQFMFAETNRRTDRWGGATLRERSRFGAEVIRAIRAAVGPDFAILIRLSQWKVGLYQTKLAATPQQMQDWLEPLADAGVDMFHCSQRNFAEPEFAGSDLNFAAWAKKLTGKPAVTVGRIGSAAEFLGGPTTAANNSSLEELERRLERGDFDLVAVGRAMLADPEWTNKVRSGQLRAIRTSYDRKVLL